MKIRAAEVRKIKGDSTKSGMVQVRLFGKENDEQEIKDEHLPWAIPMQPISSAATNGIGRSANGLRVGSRVLVTYLEDDVNHEHPIIIGSMARGVEDKD